MIDDTRPVMNDTKWAELIGEMRELQGEGWKIQHHAKDLQGPWPSPRGWDGEFFYHLRPWSTLEWVDLRCNRRDRPYWSPTKLDANEMTFINREIGRRLAKHGIPFSIESRCIRVWGYTRPDYVIAWETHEAYR